MRGVRKHGQAAVLAEVVVSLGARGGGCCQQACVNSGGSLLTCAWCMSPVLCACVQRARCGVSSCAPACVEEGRSQQELAEKLGGQGVGSRAWGHCSWKAAC